MDLDEALEITGLLERLPDITAAVLDVHSTHMHIKRIDESNLIYIISVCVHIYIYIYTYIHEYAYINTHLYTLTLKVLTATGKNGVSSRSRYV